MTARGAVITGAGAKRRDPVIPKACDCSIEIADKPGDDAV